MPKQLRIWILPVCIGMLLGACEPTVERTPPADSAIEQAEEALLEFFDHLAKGEYRQAETLFGGDLQVLIDWNPGINPLYTVTLLEQACLAQLQCLPLHRVVSANQTASDLFTFLVEFQTAEGDVFILGPCCGATETEMPPVSQFECEVELTADGEYRVLCLPPYLP